MPPRRAPPLRPRGESVRSSTPSTTAGAAGWSATICRASASSRSRPVGIFFRRPGPRGCARPESRSSVSPWACWSSYVAAGDGGAAREKTNGVPRRAADRPRRRPWSATPPVAGSIGRLYARTSARLERAGWPREPSETPREYARRLRARGLYPAGELELLADRYAAARFGNEVVGDETVEDLAAKLAGAASTVGHPGIRV